MVIYKIWCGDFMITAKEARKLSSKNNKRKEKIEDLIERAEIIIKMTCEDGKRNSAIYAGYVDSNGTPAYPEVIEHFKDLGYKIKYCYGTNLFDIYW